MGRGTAWSPPQHQHKPQGPIRAACSAEVRSPSRSHTLGLSLPVCKMGQQPRPRVPYTSRRARALCSGNITARRP